MIRLALTLHPGSVVLVRVLSADLHLLGFSGERAQRQARLLAHLALSLIEEAQTLPLLDPEGHTHTLRHWNGTERICSVPWIL